MNEILIDLLLKIHLYYPIGLPQINYEYPGHKLFQDKIAMKIDHITDNKKTPWNVFFDQAVRQFESYRFFDFSFQQFPNYIATIQLEKIKDNEKEITKELVINISLLANYFTIFNRDTYKFLKYDDRNKKSDFPVVEIVYYKQTPEKKFHEMGESLKTLILNQFDNYSFVDLSLLLNTEIEGSVIYGNGSEFNESKKYSIYELLFNSNIIRERIKVME